MIAHDSTRSTIHTSRTVITNSPEETMHFGAQLAGALRPGTVIALIGDLGSGKTCLTQGICVGLEVNDYVTSPTFTLINEYQGRLPVYHFDFYRIDVSAEVTDLGIDEYFYGHGVCIIEWAEKIQAYLPDERIEIRIQRRDATEREIQMTYFNISEILQFPI
jgi:tRNA threonylcarbamoyladenosine biosynthesis protein TsaE